MSNENQEDEEGGSALDHFFNALGHIARGVKRAQPERDEVTGLKKMKRLKAFDDSPAASPPASDCCIAKR